MGRKTGVDGKNITKNPQYWRQSIDLERAVQKEFTVNLKAVDGYLNYWVLFENYREYLYIPNTEDYFPDMTLSYLDRDGYQMLDVVFRQPLMKSISEVEMNYSATAMEFRTFAVTFKYNTFEIGVRLD